MASNLKGNLGLKSSPLAPTACKLSSQYLVLDHMTNHYNKIAKAKPSIDSKPPKCFSACTKMRDRRRREKIMSSQNLAPRPVSSASDVNANQEEDYYHILNHEPEDEEERLAYDIMRQTLMDKPRGSSNATYGTSTYMGSHTYPNTHVSRQFRYTQPGNYNFSASNQSAHPRPSSARSARSGHSLVSTSYPVVTQSHDPAKITYNGDVLEKRAHVFTEPDRPFTPRTLKNNHESRLRNSKCYNPPRAASAGSKLKKSEFDRNENQAPPRPQPRGKKHQADVSPTRDFGNNDLQDTLETSQLSESMLMDITLRSRDGRHGKGGNQQVPPLAISMDKDHMNWLQEQASKAEVRARSSGTLKSSLHDEEEYRPVKGKPSLGESVKKETKQKDEEQKYLAFAREVTDDVLSRGICSDSVLQRVFENHIEKKKHELDEERLRKVIRELRKDLGLSDVTYELKPVASLADSNYNNNIGKVTVVVNGHQDGTAQQHSGSSKSTAGSIQQQHSGSSKSTSGKDSSSLKYPPINGDTSTTLEPLNVMTSHSELSTTLESTSTIKFGQTGDMFSTINSEATLEAEEEADTNGDSELTATQALKQYQFNLTVKEASADMSTSVNSNGEKDTSEHSAKLERPATGERRQDEDAKSDTSSVKGRGQNYIESAQRTKRRNRFRQAREVETSSSANNSQPSSEHGFSKQTSDEIYSSDKSAADVTHAPRRIRGAQKNTGEDEAADIVDDGDVSVKSSSSSQRPAVKPRTRMRKGSHQSSQGPDENHQENHHERKSSHPSVHDGEEGHEPVISSRRASHQSVQSRRSSHQSVHDKAEESGAPFFNRKGSHASVVADKEDSPSRLQSRKGSHASVNDREENPSRVQSRKGSHQDSSVSAAASAGAVTDEERGEQRHSARGEKQDPAQRAANRMNETHSVENRIEDQHHVLHQQAPSSPPVTEKSDEYEDDYEEDYNADEDEGQGGSTHRTSDDDF